MTYPLIAAVGPFVVVGAVVALLFAVEPPRRPRRRQADPAYSAGVVRHRRHRPTADRDPGACVVSGVEWLEPPVVDGYGRRTIGRWGGYTIDVCPMLFNDRLVLTPESAPDGYDYGWCYPKGGAAEVAARIWDPETQAEPAGYVKAVIAGRVAGQRAAEPSWPVAGDRLAARGRNTAPPGGAV